jgi:hypothetical protein
VEAQIPDTPEASSNLPKVRRQLERICESLGIDYDDLAELHVLNGRVVAVLFDRKDGEFYRNEFGKLAMRQERFPVDLITFVGDERDI